MNLVDSLSSRYCSQQLQWWDLVLPAPTQLAEKKFLEDQQRADGSNQRRGSRRNSDQYERFDQRTQPHTQPRAQPPLGESFLDGFGKQDIKAIAARERAERAYHNALPQPHVRALARWQHCSPCGHTSA